MMKKITNSKERTKPELYLIGGGWDESSFEETFGRFVQAGTRNGYCKILLVLVIENLDARSEITEDFTKLFCSMGNVEVEHVFLSTKHDLTREMLTMHSPTCIFVGGGLTPKYQEYIVNNRDFRDYILQNNIPYGGFSAGAAISSEESVVGGWKINEGGKDIPVLDSDFSEDLGYIEVRKGLGFFPYPIDVHGSQWGTITRMIHAVDQNLVSRGLVIDESTMVVYRQDALTVHGAGQVYLIKKGEETIELSIFKDGDSIR